MSRRIYVDSSPSDDLRSNYDYEDLSLLKCSEILEFQTQELIPLLDDQYTAYSLPFWMCRSPANSDYEISDQLLSHSYHCTSSFSSSPSRIQAIEDGKKVLMELIQNMPESSYELSLKDIIDDQQKILEEQARNEMIPEGNFIPKTQDNLPRRNKKTSTRVQPSPRRIESMNSKVFLLKIFIPVSIGFRINLKKRNGSRALSRPLFNGHVKPISADWGKNKMELSDKGDKKKCVSTSREGTRSNKKSKKRIVKSNFPSCWQFFSGTKFK